MVAEKTKYQPRGDAQPVFGAAARFGQAGISRPGMERNGLCVFADQKYFRVTHVHRSDALEVRPGKIIKVSLGAHTPAPRSRCLESSEGLRRRRRPEILDGFELEPGSLMRRASWNMAQARACPRCGDAARPLAERRRSGRGSSSLIGVPRLKNSEKMAPWERGPSSEPDALALRRFPIFMPDSVEVQGHLL